MSLFALVPILYLVGNAYVFWRGKQALQAQPKGRRLLFALVYWLGALSIFPEFLWHSASSPVYLLRLLHQVGTGWMVFTLYMVLALSFNKGDRHPCQQTSRLFVEDCCHQRRPLRIRDR